MDIGIRTVSVEPMSIIMNLGMSPTFQRVNFGAGGVEFPATMAVDYVRVYQLDGQNDRITCDPADHPTAQYINDHLDLYTNPNYTVYHTPGPRTSSLGVSRRLTVGFSHGRNRTLLTRLRGVQACMCTFNLEDLTLDDCML